VRQILGLGLLVASLGCAASARGGSDPAFQVTVSPGGDFLALLSLEGRLKVFDLSSRRSVFEPVRARTPNDRPAWGFSFVAFQGAGGRVLWECAWGQLCWRELRSGKEGIFLNHDPQDRVVLGISSVDGWRQVFGTMKGRVFAFDVAKDEQRTLKPRDIWTAVSPYPIYTLEGTQTLEHFVTGAGYVGLGGVKDEEFGDAYMLRRKARCCPYDETLIRYEGITLWSWSGEKPRVLDDGYSDKVHVDFAPDGAQFVVMQKGWIQSGIYETTTFRRVAHLLGGGDGIRYLDGTGRFLGRVTHSDQGTRANRKLFVYTSDALNRPLDETVTRRLGDVPWEHGSKSSFNLELKNAPANGPRVLAVHREKGWVFVGLAKGGVDWYRFHADPVPRLEYLVTLR